MKLRWGVKLMFNTFFPLTVHKPSAPIALFSFFTPEEAAVVGGGQKKAPSTHRSFPIFKCHGKEQEDIVSPGTAADTHTRAPPVPKDLRGGVLGNHPGCP